MPATSIKYVTVSQDGLYNEREFVVACKGRPFIILTSSNLPTPAVSLIDHKLVAELKLRVTDLQCSRFHYGGKKLRILGKVSTSVQCIMNGMVCGNMHLKASVVENLNDIFDAHSIAGNKLSEILTSSPSHIDTTEPTNQPSTPTKPKKRKKKLNSFSNSPSSQISSSPTVTINQLKTQPLSPGMSRGDYAVFRSPAPSSWSTPSPSISPYPGRTRTPPGFSPAGYSPSVNIACLNAMGGSADGSNPGPILYSGHGPGLCLPDCRRCADPPINCGYNPDWTLPANFQLCGHACRGGFCGCLRGYDDNGYYG